ncbi:hypothetical protein TEA_025446 [Camellia sinensis var. sinensis]|uniref:EF-hand domain-containing protein n=1 Tax=Camellia sinensis var. sinensis TaxID=542762 RepID=A0A4S4DDI2_CAMSN|nr:hypothetical protein TEA_025446 [Camellia sinensis var. sinensis]
MLFICLLITFIKNEFDTNGNGKISMTELVSVMKALQSNTSEDEVKRMIEELNTDLNGFINLKEFCKSDLGFNLYLAAKEKDQTTPIATAAVELVVQLSNNDVRASCNRDYKPGKVRRDPPSYSCSNRFSDNLGNIELGVLFQAMLELDASFVHVYFSAKLVFSTLTCNALANCQCCGSGCSPVALVSFNCLADLTS